MALDPNRWTLKVQDAFSSAVEAAKQASNPEVTPTTCWRRCWARARASSCPCSSAWARPLPLRNQVNEALAKLPRSYGGKAWLSVS